MPDSRSRVPLAQERGRLPTAEPRTVEGARTDGAGIQDRGSDGPSSDAGATERSSAIHTTDGLRLTWRSWECDGRTTRADLLIVPGLFEHSERYRPLASYFTRRGYACHALDLRGHGESEGRRVHVGDFADYVRDVETVVDALRSGPSPGRPLVLVGHSMGGVVAVHFALGHGEGLAGLVLSSPAFSAHPENAPPGWLAAAGRLLAGIAPKTLIDARLDPASISRDPEVVAAYRADPRIGSRVSARWFTAVSEAQRVCFKRADELAVPALVLQAGADRLVDPEASRDWARRVQSRRGSAVRYREWAPCAHELFNEPESLEIFGAVLAWLDELFTPR
ncbi:MAG: lysophospholipase [Acidobacteriota bacterium]